MRKSRDEIPRIPPIEPNRFSRARSRGTNPRGPPVGSKKQAMLRPTIHTGCHETSSRVRGWLVNMIGSSCLVNMIGLPCIAIERVAASRISTT
jgi:hypothetical protein